MSIGTILLMTILFIVITILVTVITAAMVFRSSQKAHENQQEQASRSDSENHSNKYPE